MNNTSGQFQDVVGYISEPERIALQKCVLEVCCVNGDILEIGSLNGLSALLMLSMMSSDKTLICIEQGQVETLAENLSKHGFSQRVAIKNQDFNTVELLPDIRLSLVFCDHNHTFENNIAAFEKFWPHLAAGGIFIFHDYGHSDYKDGTLAIHEIADSNKLKIEQLAGSLVAFKKI